ncbi:thiamine pyrophosphate-binding protein [Roseixanthobacter glucoisosaccharinicivorans]|uniref:thiamine pyrophosphate-binding protein n=1 Tax=Roseixanthobacter glucoisosaccharinicivorans TaxID=3119923 RepID=UPI0037277BED
MTTLRGADIVARTLEGLGVTRIFTLSGNHIMPVFDALLSTRIEIIHVRQEAACVHMADAWGRLTGEVGVALVTGGQGHSNGAAALFTALGAESPVLLLSGHAGLKELGRGAFQEMAQADIARPMTKASWTAASTAGLADDLARAVRIAREGRPGPVHLSLPVDLLEASVTATSFTPPSPGSIPARHAEPAVLAKAADLLRGAERPLILCGPALCDVSGRAAMLALETATGIPVIGMESPRGINDPSLGSFAEILAKADVIALVGKALDFTLKFGDAPAVSERCNFIVLDPDAELIARAARDKGPRLLASGIADPRPTLADLGSALAGAEREGSWLAEVREALGYIPPDWNGATGVPGRVHPVDLCRAVGAFLDRHPGGTLICDGGEIGQWPQALIKAERRLVNGVSGTIGVSIPFAIATKALSPQAPVVAILGDGTFGFHMAEFDTAVRYGLPIIAVVGNDARWNAEHQIQLRSFGAERARHCDLLPTRYDQVAAALGGFGACVTHADDLPDALERAHASGRPACINVMIESVPAPVIRRPAPG